MLYDIDQVSLNDEYIYSPSNDSTQPYYEDKYNMITRDQFPEMEKLNAEPLNKREIKLVRVLLPSAIPATRKNLLKYVNETESDLARKLHDTYVRNEELMTEYILLRTDGYTPLKETLEDKIREKIDIKTSIRYYEEMNRTLKHIIRDLNEKIKAIK